MLSNDNNLYHAECAILAATLGLLALTALCTALERSRPALRLRRPMLAAFFVRGAVAVVLEAIPSTARRVRGPDDAFYIHSAQALAARSLPSLGWLHHFTGDTTTAIYAAQVKLLSDPGELSLRFTQISFVVAGLLILAAAVHDLAGARAGNLTAWIAGFEPSSVFFSSLIQKESLALLGEGLLALGCVRAWRKVDWRALTLICGGAAVVAGVRPYAGAFALLAGVCVAAVSAIRVLPHKPRIQWGIAAVAILVLGLAASVATPYGRTKLEQLQHFQQEGAVSSRLELEPVNFSTVGGLASGLPMRVRDYLLKPYPWQRGDLSQSLGAGPTLLAWLLIAIVLASLVFYPSKWLERAPPLAIPVVFVTICYALTTANSGTGFRHRTHLLFFLTGLVTVVWADRLPSLGEARAMVRRPRSRPDAAAA